MSHQYQVAKLFYDVASPYSFIAFEYLTRAKHFFPHFNLQLCPIYLGGIMKATGNKPPGLIPEKASYMLKDLKRASDFFNVEVFKAFAFSSFFSFFFIIFF